MLAAALIFLGGGIGSVTRHGMNVLCARLFGLNFPWGTFAVNLLGSFAIGWLAAFFRLSREGCGLDAIDPAFPDYRRSWRLYDIFLVLRSISRCCSSAARRCLRCCTS